MTYQISLFMCCKSDDGWGQLHSIDLFHYRVIVKDPVFTRLEVDVNWVNKDSVGEPILMMIQLEAYLPTCMLLMMMRAFW